MHLEIKALNQLRLLQLADSALAIGSASHSLSLETLFLFEHVTVEQLETFLRDYLVEAGRLESAFCRAAHHIGVAAAPMDQFPQRDTWRSLNQSLGARKPARETRAGSAALGRRLLKLAMELHECRIFREVLSTVRQEGFEVHHCTAFGLICGVFGLDEESSVQAYLHQSLAGLISASQRLAPLGQTDASKILWRLKPFIVETSGTSREIALDCDDADSFTPILELASMVHPYLETRLFIS
jgi:urease accessory protein